MKKVVPITAEESNEVFTLFSNYNSYMSMLEYLSTTSVADMPIFDKKWAEAAEINKALEQLKRAIEIKYKPSGEWKRFEFDFDKQTVIFFDEEG